MAGYTDQVLKLDIPGDLPVSLEAHYDVTVDTGRFGPVYQIDLGYVDWTLAGHKMYCMEGKEIPPAMRDKILAAITVTEAEMKDALADEADARAFERAHAPGVL